MSVAIIIHFLLALLLHSSFSQSLPSPILPIWNETRIMFFGDEAIYYGYIMPSGFVNIFKREIQYYVKQKFDLVWDNISTVYLTDIRTSFDDFRKSINEQKPTTVILQFGLYGVVNGIFTISDANSYHYYLDGILSIAKDENVSVIVCSPSLYGDDISTETPEFLALETIVGISGTLSGRYNYQFVDVFLSIYKFLARYNKFHLSENVVTIDKKILNDNGNKIVAHDLLKVFGATYHEADFAQLARATPLISQSTFFEETPFFQHSQYSAARTTEIEQSGENILVEITTISGAVADKSYIDDQTKSLLEEDSILAPTSD
jgi:hypothetical protein